VNWDENKGDLMKRRDIVSTVTSAMAVVAALSLTPAAAAGQITASTTAKAKGGPFAWRLTVYDRQGKVVRTVGEPAIDSYPSAFSPDGTRLAVVEAIPGVPGTDVSVVDLSTAASTRVMTGPAPRNPVWSPDGSQIVYASNSGGSPGLYRKAANGTGDAELLYRHPTGLTLTDWSPDGRFLSFYSGNPASVYVLPLNAVGGAPAGPGERKAIEVVGRARGGRFSPDSRFLAYLSNQSGRVEIWVRPFDASAAGGATSAAGPWLIDEKNTFGMVTWRQDGKEVYYLARDGGVMAVEVSTAPSFTSGKPRLLFKAPDGFSAATNVGVVVPFSGHSISRDGQQVLFAVPPARGARFPRQLTVFTLVGIFNDRGEGTNAFVKDDKGDVKYLFMDRGGAPTQAIRQ
jgi:serine/threonine-protein kinase